MHNMAEKLLVVTGKVPKETEQMNRHQRRMVRVIKRSELQRLKELELNVHTHYCRPCNGTWECAVNPCLEKRTALCPHCEETSKKVGF